ncbi:MAG: RsmE family RNA methyltransferase, partial [Bacteroidota bacterium]
MRRYPLPATRYPLQLFYDPDLQTGPHELRSTEAQHAFRVLRKQTGDVLDLVDGKGGWYRGTVTEINKRNCLLDVTELRRETHRSAYRTTLLIAPTKNVDRFEWALEKATEVGVDRIQPVLTEHSERKRIRTDRHRRIMEAAMKQCLRAWLPVLEELLPLPEALSLASGVGYLPYLGNDGSPLLRDTCRTGSDVTVAIGPEGGFSPAEAELARERGFHWVSLGPNRLRTETAAVAALHTIESLNW